MSFAELVTAATVGLTQRPIDLPGTDPAGALLDRVARIDAANRAAGYVATTATPAPPAPDDTAPELPDAAAQALRETSLHDLGAFVDLLAATAAAGFRCPAPLLPWLIALAARERSLRVPVAGVLGERGRWLAALHPDGARLAARPHDPDSTVWTTGQSAERVSWFAAHRATDPDAARDLVAAGWARETGTARADLLATFAVGLRPADETFLEHALDDRKREVRETASLLLTRLPGSALGARAAARARACVRLERGLLRRRVEVTLPGPPDDVAVRDGVPTSGQERRPGAGEGVLRLVRIVAAAPLDTWTEDPDSLVGAEVADGLRDALHQGWSGAAARERDGRWARALLRHGGDPGLVAFLPAGERLELALRGPAGLRAAAAVTLPAPWPAELADAVVSRAATMFGQPRPPRPDPAMEALGRCAPLQPDRGAAVAALADRARDVPAAEWVTVLERAARTLTLRHRFHRALEASP